MNETVFGQYVVWYCNFRAKTQGMNSPAKNKVDSLVADDPNVDSEQAYSQMVSSGRSFAESSVQEVNRQQVANRLKTSRKKLDYSDAKNTVGGLTKLTTEDHGFAKRFGATVEPTAPTRGAFITELL